MGRDIPLPIARLKQDVTHIYAFAKRKCKAHIEATYGIKYWFRPDLDFPTYRRRAVGCRRCVAVAVKRVASAAGRGGDGSEGGGEMVVFGCGVAAAGNGCGGGGEKMVMVVVVERAAVVRW
ncbi:hypothetical protein Tco_0842204 [Tanacetum coccineum]|uniref:Uncharacterized protein n=1 Tax=Tanacetum coccineum TaxID=301880 RepID=A0ABQ5B0S7_9ASTR